MMWNVVVAVKPRSEVFVDGMSKVAITKRVPKQW